MTEDLWTNSAFLFGMFLVILIGLPIAIAWLLLPFAVFGLKRRLNDINETVRKVGQLLEDRLPAQGKRPGEDVKLHPGPEDDIFSFGPKGP